MTKPMTDERIALLHDAAEHIECSSVVLLTEALMVAKMALRNIVNTTSVGPVATTMSGLAYEALRRIEHRSY